MEKLRIKRHYQSWVANETLEDYSLRYASKSYRRWTPFLLANTAIGGISFLALEAIGGSITITYGFQNAFPAIVIVSLLIFITNFPIVYYASKENIDIDLLTRGAGFGYIGSTITSIIYASFTFIFFALEAAIMAQALQLYFGLNIVIGYLISSLIIIPIVFFGVTLINQLQIWTQPVWIILMVSPLLFVLYKEPGLLAEWAQYTGVDSNTGEFNVLLFGAASGVLFSLVAQVGEQVDYLRFLPNKTEKNKVKWWASSILAGPGWIFVGALKILAGSLLAFLLIQTGEEPSKAVEPIRMYIKAYEYVFESPFVILTVATIFVLISQIKINVTNAYAGSLAWSNFFCRLTHYHPGRVVWLVFNVLIALLLMLLGIFHTLEGVLTIYSIVAVAWIGSLFADLVVLKPLKISPGYIEFKRAYLYNFNPVGCGSMTIASVLGITAYLGLFGPVFQVFSVYLSLFASFTIAILIGVLTKGRYYIARENLHFSDEPDIGDVIKCCICEIDYEANDMAQCPYNEGPICSLCCGLDNHCHDVCKKQNHLLPVEQIEGGDVPTVFAPHIGRRIGRFFGLFFIFSALLGAVFLLSYRLLDVDYPSAELINILTRIYTGTLVIIAIVTWWVVLSHESRELAEAELLQSMNHLDLTRNELVESEKMSSLGDLVAGIAHEINTPIGITVSASSYLQQETEELKKNLNQQQLSQTKIENYLDHAEQSSKLILSNTNRAAKLIQTFKQLAVDQVSDERRQFDLRRYLEEIFLNLRPKLKGLKVNVKILCPENIAMDSYPGPLAQVITNFVINSLQHAFHDDHQGEIIVRVNTLDKENIEINYSDNGVSIPPHLKDKIFEPFFTTRRSDGGSGLGLYLVYNIVTHKLGGTIEFTVDGTNSGNTFMIRIPQYSPFTQIDKKHAP